MAYNLTKQKLAEFTDDRAFEDLCAALLVSEYGRIVPLGGSRDQGRDAVEPAKLRGAYTAEDHGAIFQFSLQKAWKKKVNDEIKKVFGNGFRPTEYVFVSSREIGTEAQTSQEETLGREFGTSVRILDESWLQARLESPEYLQARRQYLGLDPGSLPAFLTVDDYDARRIDRLRAPDFNVFFGREAEVERLKKFLAAPAGRGLLLSASPGIGKTKLMLEAGRLDLGCEVRFLRPEVESIDEHLDELPPLKSLLLVVDDAHELLDLKPLLALLVSPEFGDRLHLVLAAHPWAKQRIADEFASRAIDLDEFDLPVMTDEAIDQLIVSHPINVSDKRDRGVVVRVAEGNPLVAVIAANLLLESGSLSGLTRNQVIAAHFRMAVNRAQSGTGEDEQAVLLLAVVSATKGIEYPQFRGALAEVVGVADDVVDRLVEALESMGMLRWGWRGLRVIPELLAEHLVLEAFFARGHRYDFNQKVLEPFFSVKGDRIFRSLAEAEQAGASGAGAIIDKFLDEARTEVRQPDALRRQAVLGWLKSLAFFRPEEALLILRALTESDPVEPTPVDSIWGRVTVTDAHVLRSATQILAETSWHCEACLRETLNLLYAIAARQDHERANTDPWGDSIRVLVEQVIAIEPGKSLRAQEIALEEIARWVEAKPSPQQIEVIVTALAAMFSVYWRSTTQEPSNRRTVTFSHGLINLSEEVQVLRGKVRQLLVGLYEVCDSAWRVRIAKDVASVLTPYTPQGLPDEIREALTDDGLFLLGGFAQISPPESIAERYEVYKSIEILMRLDAEPFEELKGLLWAPEIATYAHLMEWPGHISRRGSDWREAETQHRKYWDTWIHSLSQTNLNERLVELDRLLAQAAEAREGVETAAGTNLGVVGACLCTAKPEMVEPALEHISRSCPSLQGFAGALLGALHQVDRQAAVRISKEWAQGENPLLQREAVRSLLWVPDQDFGQPEIDLLDVTLERNDVVLDRMVVGFFSGIVNKVFDHEPETAVRILKAVASRGDSVALGEIADCLRPETGIGKIDKDDLGEIVMRFVDVSEYELDYDVERVLMRLFALDHGLWLAFWEARIEREANKEQGERYWAVPFHLSAEAGYVSNSPHRVAVFSRFLEWSSRKDYAYSHSGSSLFKLYSGNSPEAIDEVLNAWLDSGDVGKQRTVAQVLQQMGYGDYFLEKAKQLLAWTDDDAVRQTLSHAISSMSWAGSPVGVIEGRKGDLQKWLDSGDISLMAKVFARQEIDRLSHDAELHSTDELDDLAD